jgi:predicted dehydrogenase
MSNGYSDQVETATIALVGAGWRAEYFLRIAQALPERFNIGSVVTRSASSAERISSRWQVPADTSLRILKRGEPPDYVIVSVPPDIAPQFTLKLIAMGVPVLCETPPAQDIAELAKLYRRLGDNAPLQIAEQYQFQPHHYARLALARSGRLGTIGSALISATHGYHAISLLRLALGSGFQDVAIDGRQFYDSCLDLIGRQGWLTEPAIQTSARVHAILHFGDSVGIYDFSRAQYFSPIRSRHMAIYGTRGEVFDDAVRYIQKTGEPVHSHLLREDTGRDGNLEGVFLRSITLGEDVLFRNSYVPARLTDDELAGAEVMSRMFDYARFGSSFYGLADASHDHYLSLLLDEAVATGKTVRSSRQPWTSDVSSTALIN